MARRLRPICGFQPVGGEQCECKPIHAEGDTAGVHHRTGFVVQIPRRAEVIAVIVKLMQAVGCTTELT